ncbi:hypothetical protein [Phenylobacterium sp.]|uniref:hypothetical protein n=1 Tax=Phenylobacterium sp. TaxID=1871053 RepID=UPI00272EF731|nr:hypothetical protein [Phenylobacterium sp.]MDP1617907.1 hypothetical protein [Phenylobacterium sp.]MDP1988961.1 hypothetical protein [Phenylobacterium sp.]
MRLFLAAVILLAFVTGCDKPNVERVSVLEPPQIRWDQETRQFRSGPHPLQIVAAWRFENATHGVSAVNASLTPTPDGLRVVATANDAGIRTPAGLRLNGRYADLVLVRLTRLAEAPSWDGSLYYATDGQGESAERRAAPQPASSPPIGVPTLLIYDMKQPSVGRAWRRSQIDQIRLDLDNEAGGAVLIHEIAIVRR